MIRGSPLLPCLGLGGVVDFFDIGDFFLLAHEIFDQKICLYDCTLYNVHCTGICLFFLFFFLFFFIFSLLFFYFFLLFRMYECSNLVSTFNNLPNFSFYFYQNNNNYKYFAAFFNQNFMKISWHLVT